MPANIEAHDANALAADAVVSAVRASRDYAVEIFSQLREGTASGEGVTRDAYGRGEQFAHDLVKRYAAELKLEITQDAACNSYMTLPGRDRNAPSVIIGSHLDSVANGGNFDGAAGVLAGLVAVRALCDIGFRPACDLTIMGVRSEESVWFEHSYIGSRSALGTLSPQALQARRKDTHKPLEDHIRQAGGDPDAVRRGEGFLRKDRVRAFLEVHIEQSPLLVDQNRSIGIVTGIPGNFRFPNVRVIGEYGHVGLHRKFRHDAALAAAEFGIQLDAVWADWDQKQRPMAFTIGRFHTNSKEEALTKVAGECEFSLDVRAYTESDILELGEIVQGIVCGIEKRRGVKFELGEKSRAEAAESDKQVLGALEVAARDIGIPFIRMESPATHDAAAFSAVGIPIGMIFIRNENGSHNPAESMDISDFLDAAAVLTRWIQRQLA